ncbi:hypothetical protein F5148DRAFT_1378754 [Russula earlei]|uniref:Uncharacterized protein n=1 Tax=Russula earlei TaxID=71964 RepID=A0ACC0TWJ3_9AGAM|nr:hypothetical protein F5148DRAFT_1378754 [Russula earlei]
MALLETPSRIWRRIQADEQHDMPSLPEVPAFEDSNDLNATTTLEEGHRSDVHPTSPLQSTPAPPSNQNTIRLQSSTSSSARFAQSIASRASRSGSAFSSSTGSLSKRSRLSVSSQRSDISFDDISAIPSYPQSNVVATDGTGVGIGEDGVEDDMSLEEALRPPSAGGSPFPLEDMADNGHSKHSYSVSLRSEPKTSPFDRMRNVSFRKPITRMRTPSLTRTVSPSSSSSNSTPHTSESPGQAQMNDAPSLSVLSIPPPPEGSDEGEPMSLSDLPVPSDVSELQDLEEDLEQALDDEHHPTGDTGQVQSVAGSGEPQEELGPTFSPGEPTAQPCFPPSIVHVSSDRFESQSQMLSMAQSSPVPSVTFTPTPAFPPRPRPRFFPSGLPSTPAVATERSELDNNDLITPYARRRSFLIDVINSTARPRFALPTPLPPRVIQPAALDDEDDDSMLPDSSSRPSGMTSIVEEPDKSDTTVKPFNSAFSGFTPIPRQRTRTIGRLSHPLSRGWTASGSESEEAGGGASLASTPSSHDLTAYPRVNASFDHLNAYLHGLNRRLQEESESLSGQVGLLRKEKIALAEANAALQEETEHLRQHAFTTGAGSRRSSAGRRRLSDIVSTLGEMTVDESEGDAVTALEAERAERTRDKERWRERMGEVERGVEDIIHDLEARAEKAEAVARDAAEKANLLKELEKAAEARWRAKASLGGKLLEANGKLAESTAALHDLQSHTEQLEEEIAEADQRLRDEQLRYEKLQDDLDVKDARMRDLERKISGQEAELQERERELQDAKAYITELEADAGLAMDHIEALLQEAREKAIGDDSVILTIKRESAELVTQLEGALDAAEQKMRADGDVIADLRGRVATLERERDRMEKSRTDERNAELEEAEDQIEALERELDDAHREIGRLNSNLAQSPARKALDRARDAKIEILEKEKEDLQERLNNLKRDMAEWNTPGKFGNASGISPMHRQVLNMTLKTPKTPGAPLRDMSWLHASPSDPSVAPYIAEIQRLERELGRANESIDEKLDRLENAGFGNVELEMRLDDERAKTAALEEDVARLDRREERRLRRLGKAKCPRCRHHVDLRGLNRVADGDESTVDFSMLSYASESTPAKTSESLKDELQAVNRELASMKKKWKEERQQLLGDNAVLKDAAIRLNVQIQDVKERAEQKERRQEKASTGVLGELDEAKQTIADLEEDLKNERTRLRVLTVEQTRAEREKENVLLQLRRTESDMEDVKLQLQRIKRNNNELEGELRANATAEQKARLLEVKAEENAETIEHLRHERSLLAAEHKKLQQRFKKVSEQMDKLREEQRVSQKAHNGRRHALDMQKLEIEELKKALADHADALQATEAAQIRAAAAQAREREQDVVVATLEADLVRVRRSAESLGRDLRAERKRREEEIARRDAERKAEKSRTGQEVERTRRELEKVLREKKQAGAELRLLHERLGLLEGEKRTWERHSCASDSMQQLSALRNQHRLECKGLVVQIHYLKAKFTRENTLRMDLSYQKRYLLILLSRRERCEEHILAMIAKITSPIPGPSSHKPRRKTLRVVARGVVFIQRIKHASETWRAQCAPKPAIKAALEDVRRRRKQQTTLLHCHPSS